MAEELSVRLRLRRVDIDRPAMVADGSPMYIAAERMGGAAVKYVQDEIVRFGAVDSGKLYNSIDYRIRDVNGNIIVDVGPYKDAGALEYAKYVHDGTQGPITADGKLMPVKIKGGPLLFLRSVRGQAPKPYLANALKKIRSSDFGT